MKSGEEAVGILLDLLNRADVPYMIVGSFSSNRYGVPRATHDADFSDSGQIRVQADICDWLGEMGVPRFARKLVVGD
jgi:hypothetical protein